MAGSYHHVTDENGKLRSNEDFINYIENLGDAYEAIEEMYYMIQYLSNGDADSINDSLEWFYETQPQHNDND